MKRELDHLGRFLHMAVDYKKSIGFKGPSYIEPKPKEPTKHQYDSNAAACLNFLRHYDLMDHFKLNIETNHATLADFVKQRYSSFDSGIGARIEAGKSSFKELEAYVLKKGSSTPNVSGRQEFLENLFNDYI